MNYPVLPALGRTDTSRDAAPTAPQAKTLQKDCIRILKKGPATADAVAAFLGRSVLSIRPRFTELHTLGLIEDTGRRGENFSGRRAIIWQITPPTLARIAI